MIKYLEIARNAAGPYTNVSGMIATGGFTVQRNDLDGEKAGRSTVTGEMYRMRVTSKNNLEVTCRALTQTESQQLLQLIKPEYVFVNYLDPEMGWRSGVKMYSNNVPATSLLAKETSSGTVYYWTGIKFPLIEV